MTDTLSPAPAASTDRDKPDSAPSGAFERLAAFDGLFLRAEHLNLMEDYAAALALAVGAASGPGVVYGFEVSLDGPVLSVSPGLAVMADGRPIRTTSVLTAGIKELNPGAGVYYRVGLVWGTWPHGEEAVQGLLCDSGCGGDGASTHTSRLSEGPFLKIVQTDDAGLAGQTAHHRSWLASALFREEESLARRWPATERGLPTRWRPNGEGLLVDLLPLAVLIPPLGGLDWQVDTWAVRRDRGAAPPMRHWEWHLGMRPRDVFFAQVLQFQAQLADLEQGQTAASPAAAFRETIRKLAASGNVLRDTPEGLRDAAVDDLAQQARDLDDQLANVLNLQFATSAKGWGAAPGGDLVELPPAGFVRGVSGSPESVRTSVERYLDCPGVVRKVCYCSPGDVGGLFEAAQHRDRTRTPRSKDFREEYDIGTIDLYVPTPGGGPAYDWVLFTRAPAVDCPEPAPPEPATDTVEVVHTTFAPDAPAAIESQLGTLKYPAATWAVPEDGLAVFAAVQKITQQDETFTVKARVTTDDRRPLGFLRAALLASPFVDGQAGASPFVATSVAAGATERITIETGRPLTEMTIPVVGTATNAGATIEAATPPAKKATARRTRKTAAPSGGAHDEH